MKRKTVLLCIALAMLSFAPQALARDLVIEKNKAVLSSLKSNGCHRAWLSRVLADNGLNMETARRIKPGTKITVPDSCGQAPPEAITSASVQLITDEGKGLITEPTDLVAAATAPTGGNPLPGGNPDPNPTPDADYAVLKLQLDEALAEIEKLKQRPPVTVDGYSTTAMALALGTGLLFGAVGVAVGKSRQTHVPKRIKCTAPDGKAAIFKVGAYLRSDEHGEQLHVQCPHSICGKWFKVNVLSAKLECLAHLDQPAHRRPRIHVSNDLPKQNRHAA